MKANKEDFKELTLSITTILETLRRAILTVPQTEHSDDFTIVCSNFKSLMERLLKDHTQIVEKSKSRLVRNYLRSEKIKGIISKYQKDINVLRDNLMLHCTVSTNLQVHKNNVNLSGASQTERTANEDIPEFEEFIELKQGHIQLQEEIKGHRYTLTIIVTLTVTAHHLRSKSTMQEYKGDAAGELLRADLRILACLKHRDITQVMGFCKSNIFPSLVFYENLRPIGLGVYESIDRSWDTLEDIITKHQMRHGIRAGIDHIKATIPSVFGPDAVSEQCRIIQYSPKDTARLGIYLGSDNLPKLSILTSGILDNVQPSGFLQLTYDQNNVMDQSILQALLIQFKGCVARRSEFETASLLRHFHNIFPISHDAQVLDPSVDGYHLGGVYAPYDQAFQTCQGCLCLNNPNSTHRMQLVANFSLESRDISSGNWTLPTFTEANNLKHTTTSKGMWLSFTQSEWQKSDSFLLVHSSYLNDDQRAQLYESFMAQLCHLKERLKNERPCFQCKLTSLGLVTEIYWHIDVQIGHHTKVAVTWPVDEIFLFIDNPEISEYGYIKRPNIYWSRCPQGSTRLTTLECHVFGAEVPRLSCHCWSATFDSKVHNIKPLQEFHESFGLDPFSDDVARAAGALLPRHLNLINSKQKRRHSFTIHKDIIPDRDEFKDGCSDSYRSRSPKNVRILQELSSHLGIRVPLYWQLLAAAEVLPESLRWYDLRTTGHGFEHGEVNMNPHYDELPSRCRSFMHESQSWGKSLEGVLRILKELTVGSGIMTMTRPQTLSSVVYFLVNIGEAGYDKL
ncbi:hypothetical protein M422DRAFT_268228 [Sphaerobolus stellatus SS14]|uniref:Uncharacterized protein n=1 Tax=Sphaerobolus stellatus (strain SS14) TaxID=990650 RepID=A0A0C9UYN1_SPHS4|nr:hypothetical protein M422DRAFT_268228 [Sphaerobolus stellatus SS14]